MDMENEVLVKMKDISKSFGHIKALNKVNLSLAYREILGLVGDNAAGKSTLLKTLAGVHIMDEGDIFIEGKKVDIKKPIDARKLGIETIYQDFMLAPNLDITKNIFLGRERTGLSFIGKLKKKEMDNETLKVLDELGFNMPLRTRVINLSGGQQQTVAIARALLHPPKVILMDEPTASLSVGAIDRFLQLVKGLKAKGCSIIYVSHRLPDVLEVADRIVVLRTGRMVVEKQTSETEIEEIVNFMMGKVAVEK
jgi:simple sugar transport system ATP-binding protein